MEKPAQDGNPSHLFFSPLSKKLRMSKQALYLGNKKYKKIQKGKWKKILVRTWMEESNRKIKDFYFITQCAMS